uniref:WD-repeat protein, related n=1 Tax=Neospora caninum (strain Liverpool) TaxID=572307 RepID=A0A0F7U834_NEOCL|nr:TPA: WD-repeat protein, related [Neospora caninum Liverpool]
MEDEALQSHGTALSDPLLSPTQTSQRPLAEDKVPSANLSQEGPEETEYIFEPVVISDEDETLDEHLELTELEAELQAALSEANPLRATSDVAEKRKESSRGPMERTSEDVNELDDYEQLMKDARKFKRERDDNDEDISITSARVTEKHEAIEDFIRSFLVSSQMHKTLSCFQTEWYDAQLQKSDRDSATVAKREQWTVPHAFLVNQDLKEQVVLLEHEIRRQREIASKAFHALLPSFFLARAVSYGREYFDQFKKERDFHRMHHRRLKQEKEKCTQEIKKLKKKLEDMRPQIESLEGKYKTSIREKMLVTLDRDRLAAQIESVAQPPRDSPRAGSPRRLRSSNSRGTGRLKTSDGESEVGSPPGKGSDQVSVPSESGKPKQTKLDSEWPERRRVNPYLTLDKGVGETGKGEHSRPTQREPKGDSGAFLSSAERPRDRLKCSREFDAHNAAVVSLAFHPQVELLASTSDDGTWKLWQMPGTHLVMSGEGHTDWVSSASFHPYASVLVTASGDGTVKLWSIAEEMCVHTLTDHAKPVWDCCFHDAGDFFATCSADHSIKCFDANSLRCRESLRGHADSVNAICFQAFTNCLASCSTDKMVKLWDMRTASVVRKLAGHAHSCNDVTFNLQVRDKAANVVASCDAGGVVHVWDLRKMEDVLEISCGPNAANGCAFDITGKVLAVGSSDGTVKLLDIVKETLLQNVDGHPNYVLDVHFSPDASYLCSACADGKVRIWE